MFDFERNIEDSEKLAWEIISEIEGSKQLSHYARIYQRDVQLNGKHHDLGRVSYDYKNRNWEFQDDEVKGISKISREQAHGVLTSVLHRISYDEFGLTQKEKFYHIAILPDEFNFTSDQVEKYSSKELFQKTKEITMDVLKNNSELIDFDVCDFRVSDKDDVAIEHVIILLKRSNGKYLITGSVESFMWVDKEGEDLKIKIKPINRRIETEPKSLQII